MNAEGQKQYKLERVYKGYAEVYFRKDGKFRKDDVRVDKAGYVSKFYIVERTDFDNDKTYYKERWLAFEWNKGNYEQVGRKTGYATRKEAIEALVSDFKEET